MIRGDYTIVLKTLLDDEQTKKKIEEALSDYPLYTPEYEAKFTEVLSRDQINERILNHFKYREIGFETVGRFLDELKIAMHEIMPYYNQLFISQDIINGLEDIFGNLDVTESFEEETAGQSTNDTNSSATGKTNASETLEGSEDTTANSETSSEGSEASTSEVGTNSNNKKVNSKTPASSLNIVANDIDAIPYADNVEWNKGHQDQSTSNVGNNTSKVNVESSQAKTNSSELKKEDTSESNAQVKTTGSMAGTTKHTLTRKGNQGVNTYAHDMLEFRKLFINIVQLIIEDEKIQDLFMTVY